MFPYAVNFKLHSVGSFSSQIQLFKCDKELKIQKQQKALPEHKVWAHVEF